MIVEAPRVHNGMERVCAGSAFSYSRRRALATCMYAHFTCPVRIGGLRDGGEGRQRKGTSGAGRSRWHDGAIAGAEKARKPQADDPGEREKAMQRAAR